jgi:hypothetical protein
MELEANIREMWILIKMLDAPGIEARRPSFHPVHHITLIEQKLAEIGAVLSCYARYECGLLSSHP